ncbi:MAG: YdcF family protein, partial [Clostridiaceae bacterium]
GILKLKLHGSYIISNVILRRFFKLCFLLFIVSFIIIESFILIGSKDDNVTNVDYVVVLGAGIKGKEVSQTLKYRLDKSIEVLNENQSLEVVVSGGMGYGEEISEASAMENYLIDKGIEKNRIIKEEKSTSTMENFKFTKEILGEESFKILIITSDFHMFRSKFLAKRNGFKAYGITSPTFKYLYPNCVIREYFGVIKSFLFDK